VNLASPVPMSSRPPCQGRSPPGEQLVVKQVVVKATPAGPANYPILTKSNYNQWSLLMKIKLEARGLWSAIEPGDGEFQVDRMALDAICSVVPPEMITVLATKDSVPPEMITVLATKDSAMEAWESIKTMRIGDEHIRQATAQRLRHEYEMLTFCDGEVVTEFAMRMARIVNQLTTLGDLERDDKVVLKYLQIVGPRYKHMFFQLKHFLMYPLC
jgi:hypothetical protein